MIPGSVNGQVWVAKDKRLIQPVARSSKLYPLTCVEGYALGAGNCKEHAFPFWLDNYSLTATLSGVDLRSILLAYPYYSTDSLALSAAFGTANIVRVLITHPYYESDSLTLGAAFKAASITRVLLEHPYKDSDEYSISAVFKEASIA